MPVDDMLYNRKPKSGSTNLAGTVIIDAVEPFRQARNVMGGNPVARVRNDHLNGLATQSRVHRWRLEHHRYLPPSSAIFDTILDQIGKNLH